jgi:hypothetical protein
MPVIDLITWNDYSTNPPDISQLSSNENKHINCLVELENGDHHVALFHPNIIIVGGHFEFDMPPIKRWVYLDKILQIIYFPLDSH